MDMKNRDWEERLQDGPYVVGPKHIQIKSIQERVQSFEKKQIRFGLKRMIPITLFFAIIACVWIFNNPFSIHQVKVASTLSNKASQGTIQSPINQQSNIGFSITNEGFKWTADKNALPFEETIKKVQFQVKQPILPFEVSNKVAHAIKATTKPSYDIIEMTYANA